MKPHRFLAFLAILLCGSNCLQAQDADPETAAGVRQRHMHNRYPLRFSPGAVERPFFGFYLRRYEGEGELGRANDVSYLGWNPLGLDSSAAGMWLNFENDYHGWFEHNLDVRTTEGKFVRRMKTAIDRNDGKGVSNSWAYDHFTFHHGGADAGGDGAQVDFALDPSPDFTTVTVAGQVRAQRRIVSAAARVSGGGDLVIDWKQSNVVDLHLDGPARIRYRNQVAGQHLTLIVRNPGRHTVTWPDGIAWPAGHAPPAEAPLLRCGFLAVDGLLLADVPLVYPNTRSDNQE